MKRWHVGLGGIVVGIVLTLFTQHFLAPVPGGGPAGG